MNNLLLSNTFQIKTVFIVIAIVAILAIVFSSLIVLISKLCKVEQNEKIEQIKENLAGANCGGCGYAGCADFAKAVFEGKAKINQCGPTPNSGKEKIAKILDIPYEQNEPKFAVVHCAGGEKCIDKFIYIGNEGCNAQFSVMGGKKLCPTGCLGDGSCVKTCPNNAIKIIDGVSYANRTLCDACGLCVKSCPKNIVELIPKSAKIYIACSTYCKGKEVMGECQVGCIGCGLCSKKCPEGAITMENNLPKIDYSKCTGCLTCAQSCPRKSIKII